MFFTFSKDDTCISVVFITGYQESANLFHFISSFFIFACGVIDHMAGCHHSHLCKDLNFIAILLEQVSL